MKRWLEKLSKIERTLKNRQVWEIGDPNIKVEKEEVTGKGDITKMNRWHKNVLLKLLLSRANKSQRKIVPRTRT